LKTSAGHMHRLQRKLVDTYGKAEWRGLGCFEESKTPQRGASAGACRWMYRLDGGLREF
jgi:hypothetical protein